MPLFCIYNILLTCQLFWMLFFLVLTRQMLLHNVPPLFPLIIRHREAVFTMDREGIFKLKMGSTLEFCSNNCLERFCNLAHDHALHAG